MCYHSRLDLTNIVLRAPFVDPIDKLIRNKICMSFIYQILSNNIVFMKSKFQLKSAVFQHETIVLHIFQRLHDSNRQDKFGRNPQQGYKQYI